MNVAQLQREIGVKADGKFGPISQAAFIVHFTNKKAAPITDADLVRAADRLDCSMAQIRAVRKVEAGGTGFDREGRPKILFERHKFHRLTGGVFSPAPFSDRTRGGYEVSSWAKLMGAIATGEVDNAFQSASWGAFQVMGEWWDELRYDSPYAMARSTVQGEAGHLDMLVRYIEHFSLQDEIRSLSRDPATCRAFAAAFNGPAFRANRYDEKLAAELAL